VEGLLHSDVRHLRRSRLLVDGQPIRVLTTRNVDYYSAWVVGTPVHREASLTVRRERIVADAVHEDIWVENHTDAPTDVKLQRRLAGAGTTIAVAAHAGFTDTEPTRNSPAIAAFFYARVLSQGE
jgi:hypothetical protein